MKKNLKVIFIISIITLIISLFTVCVSAEEVASDTENVEISDMGADSTEETVPDKEPESEGVFPSLYALFEENIAEIFSILSFCGTAIVMLTYKKGLLPLIGQGLAALTTGVKSLGENAAKIKNETGVHNGELKERLQETEQLLLGMENAISQLEEKLKLSENDAKSKQRYECVLNAQIDMLYEVFMAASLPQYLKERVGERVSEMKHALEDGKNDEA